VSILLVCTATCAARRSPNGSPRREHGRSCQHSPEADIVQIESAGLSGRRPAGTEGAASVVYLDDVAGERMWGYLQTDSLSQNAEEFSSQALPDVPR
jgi:hypothetical protein